MSYKLGWETPGKVLRLIMHGEISLEAFIEIDGHINKCLQDCDEQIALVVDASDVRVAPYSIERIKSSQTYLQSYQIEQLVVVSTSKLNRLAMLLLFNLSRPKLQICDNHDQAHRLLKMFGYRDSHNADDTENNANTGSSLGR